MNILFYSSFNSRARDAESVMLYFKKCGHRVLSLSLANGDFIHPFLKERGIETYSTVYYNKFIILHYIKHLLLFIRFCRKEKVDIVYSHLEYPSFVSVIGQFFIKAKVFICRHHINEAALYNFDKKLSYKLTYKLARNVVVVSERAKQYMIEKEKISGSKIEHINLAYDFSLYPVVCKQNIDLVRSQYSAEVLIVTICRLTTYKRPEQAIHTVKKLIDSGIECKLLILGRGEMYEDLKEIINDLDLGSHVFLLGHVQNVLDYIAAADYLLHPSVLESSCVVVKEAGLVKKPIIVCKGVGDFDEYIQNEINGFIVEQDNFIDRAKEVIQQTYQDQMILDTLGRNLHETIIQLFDINQIIQSYEALMVE